MPLVDQTFSFFRFALAILWPCRYPLSIFRSQDEDLHCRIFACPHRSHLCRSGRTTGYTPFHILRTGLLDDIASSRSTHFLPNGYWLPSGYWPPTLSDTIDPSPQAPQNGRSPRIRFCRRSSRIRFYRWPDPNPFTTNRGQVAPASNRRLSRRLSRRSSWNGPTRGVWSTV